MKVQEFCSKIREDNDGLFRVLRDLKNIDAQTLLDDGDSVTWNPWAPVAATEPLGT